MQELTILSIIHHCFVQLFKELTSTLNHSYFALLNSGTLCLLLYFQLSMTLLHLRGHQDIYPFLLANSFGPVRGLATKWAFFNFFCCP
ncbi:hypothetical protein E2C01_027800 [Portunus trituberculatus]|uniref:Uncharacterized protein n=1 Tax=Portunus trituberculatus TaxID=210409 RepID=A0A5B7EN58_PORTR|nr:hypothetical protein [Portunus trituberculatus]